MQNPQRQRHHLQILTPRRGSDIARFRPHIVDDGFLQPGDQEMRAFVHDVLLDTLEAVENHGAGAAFDVVDGELADGESDGAGDGPAGNAVEDVGHAEVLWN